MRRNINMMKCLNTLKSNHDRSRTSRLITWDDDDDDDDNS
jgi:hypothetical protein